MELKSKYSLLKTYEVDVKYRYEVIHIIQYYNADRKQRVILFENLYQVGIHIINIIYSLLSYLKKNL